MMSRSTVPRAEYEALERRVVKTEQALRQQDAQIKILQARLEALTASAQSFVNIPVGAGHLDGVLGFSGLRDRSRSPRPVALHSGRKPTLTVPATPAGATILTPQEFASQN